MRPSFVILASCLCPSLVAAQAVCRPGKDQREAKLLAFYAAPIAFGPFGSVTEVRRGEVRLAFEGTYVPEPGIAIRRPEECYNNSKTENTTLSRVFPRPRVTVGLTEALFVEASYLPPVTVMDATPNLLSVAVGWSAPVSQARVALRAHATVGQVEGPITCASERLQTTDPSGICYANRPSLDTYKPAMFGLEGVAAFRHGNSASTYIGLGGTSLRPRFQVGFTDANGSLDNTRVEVELFRVSAFAGVRFPVGDRLALVGELYSVPQDVTTFRVGGTWTVRKGAEGVR